MKPKEQRKSKGSAVVLDHGDDREFGNMNATTLGELCNRV